MRTTPVHFENRNGQRLKALLSAPVDGKPETCAILAHCFTCNKNYNAIHQIARALTLNEAEVLRFDFTGLGESEGDFSETNFSSTVDDIISAAEYLAENGREPEILIGHSLGGAAVLMAASRIPSVKAVVTIGAPADPAHVKKLLKTGLHEIERTGEAEISLGGRPFRISRQFLHDLENTDLKGCMEKLDKPLLILHSPEDSVVHIDNAAILYKHARHPKSFISLAGADHLLTDRGDSRYAGNMIAEWVKRYISMPEEEPLASKKQVVTRTEIEAFLTEIKAGHHGLISDEPVAMGGNDYGPTPYDLLIAGLGACTGMTLRMYAQRKEWPLKTATVHLQHDKIHAQDCGECENSMSKIDYIERTIELEGDLTEEQRKKLLEIANKCPVHKTLGPAMKISTILKTSGGNG